MPDVQSKQQLVFLNLSLDGIRQQKNFVVHWLIKKPDEDSNEVEQTRVFPHGGIFPSRLKASQQISFASMSILMSDLNGVGGGEEGAA